MLNEQTKQNSKMYTQEFCCDRIVQLYSSFGSVNVRAEITHRP